MSKDRKIIRDRSEQICLSDLFDGCNFEQVKERLDEIENSVDYKKGHNAQFRVEWGYETTDVYLDVWRDENDKEYKERLAYEEKLREKARLAREKKKERARKVLADTEEAERAEFERLKAKFG